MKLDYHKTFQKHFRKLRTAEKKRVQKTLLQFQKDPFHPPLDNHILKGKRKGERAISAGGDLRLIFKEYKNYTLVLFLDVGSHNQVY